MCFQYTTDQCPARPLFWMIRYQVRFHLSTVNVTDKYHLQRSPDTKIEKSIAYQDQLIPKLQEVRDFNETTLRLRVNRYRYRNREKNCWPRSNETETKTWHEPQIVREFNEARPTVLQDPATDSLINTIPLIYE